MSALAFRRREPRESLGLKGPRAADWLTEHGLEVPGLPNTWLATARTQARATDGVPLALGERANATVLVARLGSSEFFLEDVAGSSWLREIARQAQSHVAGIHPVLREDSAFMLSGDGVHDVLSQACNVNFAELGPASGLVMTLLLGVTVLVVPDDTAVARQYRIWCDPTFGPYLDETLGGIVIECGGSHEGVSA